MYLHAYLHAKLRVPGTRCDNMEIRQTVLVSHTFFLIIGVRQLDPAA